MIQLDKHSLACLALCSTQLFPNQQWSRGAARCNTIHLSPAGAAASAAVLLARVQARSLQPAPLQSDYLAVAMRQAEPPLPPRRSMGCIAVGAAPPSRPRKASYSAATQKSRHLSGLIFFHNQVL